MKKDKIWCACGGVMKESGEPTIKCEECDSTVEINQNASEHAKNEKES